MDYWNIEFTNKAVKLTEKLPTKIILVLQVLIEDLRYKGPYPGKHWKNYGKLITKKTIDKRHCHLIKGKPTYVCCWQLIDSNLKIIEIYYVGTHEKAPY